MPIKQRVEQHVKVGLGGQRPISVSLPSHEHARETRHDGAGEIGFGHLLGHDVLGQIGRLGCAEAREDERKKSITTQGH